MAKATDRVVRAVSRRLWERDKLQMRMADALMSTVETETTRGRGASSGSRSRRRSLPRSTRWSGFDSVLCPVDFSEQSRLALGYAEAVALRRGSPLTVVYVNDPLLVEAAAAALHGRNVVKDSAHELQEFVDASLSPRAKTHLPLKVRAAVGDPAGQILDVADRDRSSLIVVGTHGLTGAVRAVAGSTTLGVLQHATVPVLAVPSRRGVSGPARSWPGRRIIAALELNGEPERELRAAVHVAKWFGSSLLIVHVVSGRSAPPWLRERLRDQRRGREKAAAEQLEALASRAAGPVRIDARVLRGDVAAAIASAAAAERSGLVITALRDRQAWFGAARGSISYHVLSRTETPVMAIPPGWPHR